VTDADSTGRSTIRRRRLVAGAFGLVVVIASVVPVPGSAGGTAGTAFPFGIGLTDPFHLVGYAILAALVARAKEQRQRGRVAALLVAIAVAVAVGFGIELVQATIPWRSFAWRDAAINAAGAVIGGAVAVARQ
jgi:VanZ family protein